MAASARKLLGSAPCCVGCEDEETGLKLNGNHGGTKLNQNTRVKSVLQDYGIQRNYMQLS